MLAAVGAGPACCAVTPTQKGSFKFFRGFGIDVYVHWSWFVVAAWDIQGRTGAYQSLLWNVLEYLSLFGLVLMHEFGHALACRQTGGTANQIMSSGRWVASPM